jgi:hypothetical protein
MCGLTFYYIPHESIAAFWKANTVLLSGVLVSILCRILSDYEMNPAELMIFNRESGKICLFFVNFAQN